MRRTARVLGQIEKNITKIKESHEGKRGRGNAGGERKIESTTAEVVQ